MTNLLTLYTYIHNYSQQASQRREYTNGGRSFGDSYRQLYDRGGSQQSRGQY